METVDGRGVVTPEGVDDAAKSVAVVESAVSTPAKRETFSLAPRDLSEAMEFAQVMAKSDLVPKDYHGNPGNVLVAVQMGAEVGLAPMQAIQNIAVINGRPSMWGDACLALVRASGLLEAIHESSDAEKATCIVKRKGEAQYETTFSMEDARRAKLAEKSGPWTQYPKRMLQMRARSFALRDVFPDVLKGIIVREEAEDYDVAIEGKGTAQEPVVLTPKRLSERKPPEQKADEAQASGPEAPATSGSEEPRNEAIPGNARYIVRVEKKKSGTKTNGEEWTLWNITTRDNETYSTFDEEHVRLAQKAETTDRPVLIEWAQKGAYRNLIAITLAGEA